MAIQYLSWHTIFSIIVNIRQYQICIQNGQNMNLDFLQLNLVHYQFYKIAPAGHALIEFGCFLHQRPGTYLTRCPRKSTKSAKKLTAVAVEKLQNSSEEVAPSPRRLPPSPISSPQSPRKSPQSRHRQAFLSQSVFFPSLIINWAVQSK